MASNSIKMKAQAKNGETTVKARIKHPMETGRRKDKATDKLIPAHYIREISLSYNGETLMTAEWGPTIAKNPFTSVTFTGGNPGEPVELSWLDNKGESDSATTKIK